MIRLLAALTLVAAAARAQPTPPCPACNEDPADVSARVLYERAVRAEYDGRKDDALREAQACLEQRPAGRFAAAAQDLIARVKASPRVASAAGVGPRTELVIESTLGGLYLSILGAVALNAGTQGGTALVMAGTIGALTGSAVASAGKRVPDSMPQMLSNGLSFGTYATLLVLGLSDFPSGSRATAGEVLAGASAGGLAGLLSSVYVPAGDAAAISTGMVWGGVVPLLIAASVGPHNGTKAPLWILLAGSTGGVIAGPILNHALLFSRGRWNLVSLGGFVGALMGAGVGVITNTWVGEARGGLALTAAGSVAGLLLMAKFTDSFDEDRPSTALLHFEQGRLSAGNPLAAVAPARFRERTVPQISVFDGRF